MNKLMMLLFLFVAVVLFFAGAAMADPIDSLAAALSADHGWTNGGAPVLELPRKASPEQVARGTFARCTLPAGRVRNFTVLKQRKVHVSGPLPDVYRAVLVQTDLGTMIVLMQYRGPKLGWWSRVYDAQQPHSSLINQTFPTSQP